MRRALISTCLIGLAMASCSTNPVNASDADTSLPDLGAPDDLATDGSVSDAGPVVVPCDHWTDCAVSMECSCPQPVAAGSKDVVCPFIPRNNQIECNDSFGVLSVRRTDFLLCIDNACGFFGGDACGAWVDSPSDGVDDVLTLAYCDVDEDCSVETKNNPCGCAEGVSRLGSPGWPADAIQYVWDHAEEQCGPRGECNCPEGTPTGARCSFGKCILTF